MNFRKPRGAALRSIDLPIRGAVNGPAGTIAPEAKGINYSTSHAGIETRNSMGQKVRPTGYRVGIMEDWRSRWYASKHEFADLLVEDFKIRAFIKKKYGFAGIPKIEIERTRDAVTVLLSTARPGVIIGRKGAEVEVLQKDLQDLTGRRIEIKIVEVARPRLTPS
jgi:hypothetical protein